jgi:hypothetical protein
MKSNIELLASVQKTEVKKGIVKGTIEVFKTVQRKVKRTSIDPRALKPTIQDVYSDIAFIHINGNTDYFCHISNGIEEAINIFYDGEFKKYLPRL